MPKHGSHEWKSHLQGLETRHHNGNLSDAGYADALRRFAQRYEDRAATLDDSPLHQKWRQEDLDEATYLRGLADQLNSPTTSDRAVGR